MAMTCCIVVSDAVCGWRRVDEKRYSEAFFEGTARGIRVKTERKRRPSETQKQYRSDVGKVIGEEVFKQKKS